MLALIIIRTRINEYSVCKQIKFYDIDFYKVKVSVKNFIDIFEVRVVGVCDGG